MENKDNADGKGLGDVSGGEEEVATATAPDVVLENLTTECSISRPFIDLLFSTVHVKGESRLAQEVYFVIFLFCMLSLKLFMPSLRHVIFRI